MENTEPQILKVVWRDACSEEAALPVNETVSGLVELTEVGWLIAESEESITLGMELSEGAHPGRWRLHIPKVCIVSQSSLVPAPKKRKKKEKVD